jgi:hypothetical protein
MNDLLWSLASRLLTKIFAPRPVIKREGTLLIIRSGWRTALLTLGARDRRVTIDPANRIIRVRDRRFWAFIGRQVLEFGQIGEIVYAYSDLFGNDWVSHDSEDLFRVGLWLNDNRDITLFRFFGQGEFVNNTIWPDWMMWSENLRTQIFPHDMESQALAVAELLAAMVGVPIGNGPI